MTAMYEITATVRIRVEADHVREARAEISGLLDQIARDFPTGATFSHAVAAEATRV